MLGVARCDAKFGRMWASGQWKSKGKRFMRGKALSERQFLDAAAPTAIFISLGSLAIRNCTPDRCRQPTNCRLLVRFCVGSRFTLNYNLPTVNAQTIWFRFALFNHRLLAPMDSPTIGTGLLFSCHEPIFPPLIEESHRKPRGFSHSSQEKVVRRWLADQPGPVRLVECRPPRQELVEGQAQCVDVRARVAAALESLRGHVADGADDVAGVRQVIAVGPPWPARSR